MTGLINFLMHGRTCAPISEWDWKRQPLGIPDS